MAHLFSWVPLLKILNNKWQIGRLRTGSILELGTAHCQEVITAKMANLNAQKPLKNLFSVIELLEESASAGYRFPLDTRNFKRTLRNIEEELERQNDLFGDILNIVSFQSREYSPGSDGLEFGH